MKRKDLNKLWQSVQDRILLDKIERRSNLLTLLDGSRIENINESTASIILSVSNPFSKAIIETEFKNDLLVVINTVFNSDFKLAIFSKDEWEKIDSQDEKTSEIKLTSEHNHDSLLKDFTIDNFLVSAKGENKMAKQASLSVALKPGEWTPFFIYGGSGLGKTHLLHAIGNKISEQYPNMKIKYLESKDFKDLIYENAINTNNINKINKEFLNYDVLLIDDIQMIQSLPKAKEIFFGIFSNYINMKKQIVLTSDQYPEELKDFEERFITRFKGGVLMSVTPPDLDTAKAIIKQKIISRNQDNLNLTNESLEFIAVNFGSNVRELEGALNKIIFWSITNEIKDVYTLEDMMGIFEGMTNSRGITIKNIVNIISKNYQISVSDILGKSRKAEIVLPRHIAIYFSRTILKISLMDIGRYFGRDHSTILSSISKIEKESKINKELNRVIYDLRKQIISNK